jgi:hypothetical protein
VGDVKRIVGSRWSNERAWPPSRSAWPTHKVSCGVPEDSHVHEEHAKLLLSLPGDDERGAADATAGDVDAGPLVAATARDGGAADAASTALAVRLEAKLGTPNICVIFACVRHRVVPAPARQRASGRPRRRPPARPRRAPTARERRAALPRRARERDERDETTRRTHAGDMSSATRRSARVE